MQINNVIERLRTALRRVGSIIVAVLSLSVLTVLLLVPGSLAEGVEAISPFIRILLAIAIDAGLLWFIYTQFRPLGGANRDGLIVRTSESITDVSIDSTRERIHKAVSEIPDVTETEVAVKAHRGRAQIELHVTMDDKEVSIPDKQKEINRALRRVVNKQLGLMLAGRPIIHVQMGSVKPANAGEVGKTPPHQATPSTPIRKPQTTQKTPQPSSTASRPGSADRKVEEQTALRSGVGAAGVRDTNEQDTKEEPDSEKHKGLGVFRRERSEPLGTGQQSKTENYENKPKAEIPQSEPDDTAGEKATPEPNIAKDTSANSTDGDDKLEDQGNDRTL